MSLERRLLVTLLRHFLNPDELRSMVARRRPPAVTLLMPPHMDILVVPHLCHPSIDLLKIELVTDSDGGDGTDMTVHVRYVALEELL